ncbi:MAG: hypothetical protein P4L26_03465 [Terracidiphilus sp.]|jgi:hypothetical protein|nr:hypothetical protein [Terracidiphilus sp.]
MLWMMIALLVSLAALLAAAAGVARHIWLRRSHLNSNPNAGPIPKPPTGAALDPAEEVEPETEL